jgi:hypothetical protein
MIRWRVTASPNPPYESNNRKTRRSIIRTLRAGLLLRTPPAAASEKRTRQQAEYQDSNGIYSCSLCTLFVKPDTCKAVEGEGSEDGWCKAFAMAD